MNENLINALMELIALFARVNNSRFIDNAHILLKTYLDQTVSIKNSRIHIRKFYEYFEIYSGSNQETLPDEASLKKAIHDIVLKINSELKEEERMVLFLSFLELVKLDKRIESSELTFVEILSGELHISRSDYKNSLLFILSDEISPEQDYNNDHLIISCKKANSLDELEGSWIEENRPPEKDQKLSLIIKEMEGELKVLRFQGTNFLACKYFGNQVLLLNNKKIIAENFFLVNQLDQFKVGNNLKLSYHQITAGYKNSNPNFAIKFIGENISTKNKKNVSGFAPFNFCEELGNLVVLLCNNTSMGKDISHLLTGQMHLSTGKVCLNGYNIYTERYRVHKMIGLVPSDNIFDENISIYQNFWFSARLSFPGYNDSKITLLVNQTIQNLGLSDIEKNPIRNLSNSLSLDYIKILINTGIEIIRDPLILVLNVPLEKLNSSNTEDYCNILKSECNKGKLVFIISTNPNACMLKKTDRIWIFDAGGFIIYKGLANNALKYFKEISNNLAISNEICPYCGNINADQIHMVIDLKVIDKNGKPTHKRRIEPEEWYKIYKEKIEAKEGRMESRKVIPSYASSIPNVNLQFNSYFKKTYYSLLSSPGKPFLILLSGLLLAFLIAGLLRYDWTNRFTFSQHQNLPLLFFLNTAICLIIGTVTGLYISYNEKLHIAFDHFKNYSFFSFLNVKYIALGILALPFSVAFTYISDIVSGINGLFILSWSIYFSLIFIGGSIGLFFGYINMPLRNSLLIAFLVLSLNFLFSGFVVPYNNLPNQIQSKRYIPAFAELFPGRWAYEALIVQQMKDNEFQKRLFTIEQTLSDLKFKTTILMPKLQEQLNNIQNGLEKWSPIFFNELTGINKKYPDIFQFEFINDIEKESVSSEILLELEDYIRYVQIQLYEKLNKDLDKRNELKQKMVDSIGNENFEKFVNSNFNTPLASFVSDRKIGKNYVEDESGIIQTDDPIYRLPENNFGRAHFFAPQKLMNGFYYDTSYFNLFVLWLEIFMIYIATLILRKKNI